jgi:outer membrane protein
MRCLMRWVLFLLMVVTAAPASAGKIGFLDVEKAVSTTQQGQVQVKALDDWAKPRQEQLEQLRTRAVELTNQLAAQRNVASPEAVAQLEKDVIQARRAFEDGGRAFNRDLDAKQNELLGDVALKIGEVASEYGKANDFDAIFTLQAQPLIYIADAANVTDTVIRLFDERYPVK